MTMEIRLAHPPDKIALHSARRLFLGRCEFLKGVVDINGLPPTDRVEVCFAGRSNAGKSTLINALTNRKRLARTSNTPGRTQEINYFILGETHYLVDLPGYGYARAPRRAVERWQRLLFDFLRGRPTLRRVFMLVDSRHGPKKTDEGAFALLDRAAVTFQIVMTKADKVPARKRARIAVLAEKTIRDHPAAFPEIIVTSSVTGEGIDTLRSVIASIT